MLALGNDRVNEIYEANVTLTPIKPGCTKSVCVLLLKQ